MKQYLISDLISKINYKILDYLLRIKWYMVLGHLGKGSFIRSGVKVIGNPKRIYIANCFKIYQNVILTIGKGKLEIGSNGLIGVGTYINCGNQRISIGNNVAIAPYCKIYAYSHHFSENKLSTEVFKNGDVLIEDNVLIGTNTVIMPGVKIGHGAIVGACSLVNADVQSNTIVVGVPAKVIHTKK